MHYKLCIYYVLLHHSVYLIMCLNDFHLSSTRHTMDMVYRINAYPIAILQSTRNNW